MTHLYPRPVVLDQIPRHQHAVIEASAGTGKTYTIEHLVVELLLRADVTIDQILVITFTEKATEELKRRLRAMLGRILQEARPDVESPSTWTIDALARRRLESALLNFDTASVHTIHGFFRRVLTGNAFPIGRPLEQELVDGDTAFGRAFRTALRAEVSVDPRLRRHLAGWLESGKDLESLVKILGKCLRSHRSGLRFDPEYRAEELEQVIATSSLPPCPDAAALKAALPKMNASTRGALLRRMEKFHRAVTAARNRGETLALLSTLQEIVSCKPQDLPFLAYLQHNLPAGDFDAWLDLAARLEPHAVALEAAVAQTLLPAVVRQLDADRAARGEFDFDDMIRLVWEALQGPGAEALVESLRGRFRYALIDEFQDTDDLQWQIFRRLFFGGTRHVCYLVGDPKQAIYGFRGADVHAYLDATRTVHALHGREPVCLEHSFRSTPALLTVLNRMFRQEDPAPFFSDPVIPYRRPVQCGRRELELTDEAGRQAEPLVLLALPAREKKRNVETVRRTIARAIAQDIAGLLREGSPEALWIGVPEKRRPVEARHVFILTRNTAEGRILGEELRREGVPHSFYKQEGLYQTQEAQDVLDILRAIEDPGDRSRRYKAWLSPFFDVPMASLPALAELPHTHALIQQLEEWHDLAGRREHERLFTSLADESGLVRRLLEAGAERELTNYLHLFEVLLGLAQSGARLADLVVELGAYVDDVRLPEGESPDVQRLETDRSAVQIMTQHKSKGLEADVVYVFGGYSGTSRGMEPVEIHRDGKKILHLGRYREALEIHRREQAHENERLLYVALTRARGRLVLPLLAQEDLAGTPPPPYATVNRKLHQLLEEGELQELVQVREVRPLPSAAERGNVGLVAPGKLTWPEEPDLVKERREMEALAQRSRALEMTSYSRIKRAHGGYVSPMDADTLKVEGPAPDPIAVPEAEPETLPGGAAMGIFLHEVIELLPLDTLAGPPAVEDWARDARVIEVIGASFTRHGIDAALRPAVERLIHRSLTAPVLVGGSPRSLASVPACAREMDFLFPLPEAAHPPLVGKLERALTVERGYMQGVIDLVFELDGRFYFADWKTDILPDYGETAVKAHVERNYRLQAKLYTLAMVKWLGIHDDASYERSFGGLYYCFLRGMRPPPDPGTPSPGVHFERPAWDELVAFDGALREGGDLG